ncbi:hypothetical protein [Urechidicola croceus]|uniref:Uncharacterized protein n=1 Tax=Urechidicola croceus TaxID=1850246 RepID=A0A1D8P7T5_9FLAO|nr:hypothetical protein [Urechidicola croceus]AOW20633.1 hypothetical protein LPB138_08070 [Urechidicola croceus]
MANGRIEFKIGNLEFVGEGEQNWVTEQLDKMLERIPELVNESKKSTTKQTSTPIIVSNQTNPTTDLFSAPQPERAIPENLSTFLRKKDAIDKQRRKFLGTAVWLQLNGQQMIKTKNVTDALRSARQVKITNPSHQLNQNISQGFCQKEGNGFYVTPQGVEDIM